MPTTCTSFQVGIGIPIFGLGFTSNNHLVLCGGGGAGRSGVKNKLCSYKVDMVQKDLVEEAIYEISSDEDAPMCLAIHPKENVVAAGINASPQSMAIGVNDNCRLFDIGETSIIFKKAVKSLESVKEDDYQKAVRFNKDGSLLAVGTTDGLANIFKFPYLETVVKVQVTEKNDVLDVDINGDDTKLIAVVPDALKLINMVGENPGTIIQTVSTSAISKHQLQFRAFRYGHGINDNLGFAVANGFGKSKGGFIVILDAHTLEIKKVHQVSKKPITTFCTSLDGSVIGYGAADFGVVLLEASTLKVLMEIKNAHGFSITSMAISPDRRILVSGSADNTCRVVALPFQFATGNLTPLHTLLLVAIVTGILLLLASYYNICHLYNNPIPTTGKKIVEHIPTSTIVQHTPTFANDDDEDDLDRMVSILPIPTTENNIILDDTLSSIQATATLPNDDESCLPTMSVYATIAAKDEL